MRFLLQKDNEAFLQKLIVSTYENDKMTPDVQQKICTHGKDVIAAWKNYDKKTPADIIPSQWSSLLRRGTLYIFTHPNILDLLDEHIKMPAEILPNIDNKGSVALYANYSTGDIIGEQYTDTEHLKGGRKKPASLEESYTKRDLRSVRIIINISGLIERMQERKLMGKEGAEILPEDFDELASITSICPQG